MANVASFAQIILPTNATTLALPSATTVGGKVLPTSTTTSVTSLTFGSITLNGSSNSATASLVSGTIPATVVNDGSVNTLNCQLQITPTAVGSYVIPITLPTKTSNITSSSDIRVRGAYGRDANGVLVAQVNPVPVTGTTSSPSTVVNIAFTSQSTAVHTIDLMIQFAT